LQVAQQIRALPDLKAPVLSVLLPRASFESLSARSSQKQSAIFIDQPPSRQLELLRSVLPTARSVGLVVGPTTQQDLPTYRAMANTRGLSLVVEHADRETALYPVLQSVLRVADVLLALPDSSIVNVSTAQNLLLTSFRFRVPVIGYSASYVRAGALAAVYSTPRQLGLEAGQIVRQFVRTGNLPQPKYPRYFTVTVNRQMAQSLGLSVPEESTLVQRLQQLESLE
jgi:putative ABC transport system substrate-binding protein